MKDLEELRGRLQQWSDQQSDANTLTSVLGRGPDIASAEASRIVFKADFAHEVIADVRRYVDRLLAREWLAYDPSYQVSSSQALVDGLSQNDELASFHAQVMNGDLPADVSGEGTDPVVAMAHQVVGPTPVLTVYRVTGQGIATKRPRKFKILVPADNVYAPSDGETLYYEPRFDAAVLDDQVIVTTSTVLQDRLGSPERARKMAAEALDAATAALDILGMDELRAAATSERAMIAKMAALARTMRDDPEYVNLLTMENLLEFLDGNPQVAVAVTEVNGTRQLTFESPPKKRHLIPKLLADDYLTSDLSKRHYESGSKARLT